MKAETRDFIRFALDQIVITAQGNEPNLTRGEIYDEIAQYLERHCRAEIERKSV